VTYEGKETDRRPSKLDEPAADPVILRFGVRTFEVTPLPEKP
jgi:hypothetical protein